MYLFADLESPREHFKSHTFSLFKGRTYQAMISNRVYFFHYNGQMYRLTRTFIEMCPFYRETECRTTEPQGEGGRVGRVQRLLCFFLRK
jgi:hypothetical protein